MPQIGRRNDAAPSFIISCQAGLGKTYFLNIQKTLQISGKLGDGEPDNVCIIAPDLPDKEGAFSLDAIGAGFVEGFAGL